MLMLVPLDLSKKVKVLFFSSSLIVKQICGKQSVSGLCVIKWSNMSHGEVVSQLFSKNFLRNLMLLCDDIPLSRKYGDFKCMCFMRYSDRFNQNLSLL